MATYFSNKLERVKSSTVLFLIVVNIFASYLLSETCDHHQYECNNTEHIIEDDTEHHHLRTHDCHIDSEVTENGIVVVHEDESCQRRLQTVPYFTSTTLGEKNYYASYGNPLKGLAATAWLPETQLDHAIEYTYVPLGNVLTDYNTYIWYEFEKILESTASRNRQLVPRFVIVYPPYAPSLPLAILKDVKQGEYLNYGLDENGNVPKCPFFDDPVLLAVMKSFILAYGAKFDGDKRIAYIQAGLLGFWGEYHVLDNPFLPLSVNDDITTWYKDAFKKTPIMVRYPSAATKALNVGYHDDSYTWTTLDGIYDGDALKKRPLYFWPMIVNSNHSDAWKFAPTGGEVRPDNIPWVLEEGFPAGTRNHQDFWSCATITHTVYMKYGSFDGVGSYSFDKGKWIHSEMGYNFQLREVSASLNTATVPSTIDVSVKVEQIGYTPFYYPLSLAFQCSNAILQTVPGVEKLIDQFQIGVFTFRNIAINPACLSSVKFTLESDNVPLARPVKWAQGTNGIVILPIPLPPGRRTIESVTLSAIAESVSTSDVADAPVLTSVDVVVTPLPTPVNVIFPVPTDDAIISPEPTPAIVTPVHTSVTPEQTPVAVNDPIA